MIVGLFLPFLVPFLISFAGDMKTVDPNKTDPSLQPSFGEKTRINVKGTKREIAKIDYRSALHNFFTAPVIKFCYNAVLHRLLAFV